MRITDKTKDKCLIMQAVKDCYDRLDEASLIAYNENVKLVKELEHVNGKAATEVVDLQREVVTLQRDLLAEKDRQLTDRAKDFSC